MLLRRAAVLAAAAVVVSGLASGIPARGHAAVPECQGDITVEDVRGHRAKECVFHFQGLPIVVEGAFFTDHPQLKSNIHVGVIAELSDGSRQVLPVECVDYGRANDPNAQCRVEWDPTSTGPHSAPVPLLHDIVALICEAHSHATESRFFQRYFGEDAGGWFRCSSGPAGEDGSGGGGSGGAVTGGALPTGAPAFAAAPVNLFATDPAVVSRTVAKEAAPVFANLDQNRHDVVALDARHPDGSASWCHRYEPGTCPLFWSDLIGPAETTPVLGFDAVAPGAYRFYCSIHPDMVGTVHVVA